jgi:hypothetical protein
MKIASVDFAFADNYVNERVVFLVRMKSLPIESHKGL